MGIILKNSALSDEEVSQVDLEDDDEFCDHFISSTFSRIFLDGDFILDYFCDLGECGFQDNEDINCPLKHFYSPE